MSLMRRARCFGEILIGYFKHPSLRPVINPKDKSRYVTWSRRDRLVVLAPDFADSGFGGLQAPVGCRRAVDMGALQLSLCERREPCGGVAVCEPQLQATKNELKRADRIETT